MATANTTIIARAAAALFDMQLGNASMTWANNQVNSVTYNGNVNAFVQGYYNTFLSNMTNAQVAAVIVKNVGIAGVASAADTAAAEAYVAAQLAAAGAGNQGAAINTMLGQFALLTGHPVAAFNTAATAFNTQIRAAEAFAQTVGTIDAVVHPPLVAAQIFNLTPFTALGADGMRLTGGMDVIINMSNPANQITGLDLNGNGVIEFNGSERSITGRAANFEIVDAYPRNPLNHTDSANNFLGDIEYLGTGFGGDGVNTNGNVVLGGLGVDQIFGGIGNDFLAGGGIAQGRAGFDWLNGGRNADFFFAAFSPLDRTDGPPSLRIDGGDTADDNSAGVGQSAQDSDWLLLDATDDDETVTVWLNDDNVGPVEPGDGIADNMGRVLSRSGKSMVIDDIENLDGSGNLYGFVDNINVMLGTRAADARGGVAGTANYSYGSSAQLRVHGSEAGNIIVGGHDNDFIEGNGGADLLFGGNLQFVFETVTGGITNPNMAGIVNDGRDELYGGAGNDNILFEADGGVIDGGADNDTLWLTNYSLGTRTAAQMTTDGRLRFDLTSENGLTEGLAAEGGAGYGGANVGTTADQTNYVTGLGTAGRVTVRNMENIDATGLGAIDYFAAGTNNPELKFTNQQNFKGYNGNLQLLGTQGANRLYAGGGHDEIHGRGGNDDMQGGAGNDDFYFALDGHFDVGGAGTGDGVDVIRRKVDANGDSIWDGFNRTTGVGTWGQDFGLDADSTTGASVLTIRITDATKPGAELGAVVNAVTAVVTAVKLPSGTFDPVTLNTPAIAAARTYAELATALNNALKANATYGADLSAVLLADGVTIEIRDAKGRELGDAFAEGGSGIAIQQIANSQTQNVFQFGPPLVTVVQDRIIYKAWEDRNDNEGVNDNTVFGSTMSLGRDAYAEDLVISFQADGTRLAEDQRYTLTFDNLTTQDRVTVNVNGVLYQLQVGIDLDGNIVAGEDTASGATQTAIQTAFLARFADFITNSFTDRHTASGKVLAAATATTIVLTQQAYNGEETVFMRTPVVTLENLSSGQAPSVTVTNNSQHEVLLFMFDGRNNKLNETNVLFWGAEHVQRANLETAKTTGGALAGTDALVIDGFTDDLADNIANYNKAAVPNNQATNAPLALTNFTVHGDDFLLGGPGIDQITGGTGDDRIVGSAGSAAPIPIGTTTGAELLDGGKNVYAVQVLGEPKARVYVLNKWEARNPTLVADLAGLTISSITPIRDNETGLALSGGVTVADTMFDDTLQFEQETFGPAARFTITLDDFTLGAGGVVQTRNDGAGQVWVDVNGNGVHDAGIDTYTRFTNFENIRTISGAGKAVAGDNQGNDTLDATKLSSTLEGAGGISYDLTGDATAGEVRYSKDAIVTGTGLGSATGDRPAVADYEELVIKVDGVENVFTNSPTSGHDLVVVDETEAAKNNTFNLGLGIDRVSYIDDYDGAPSTGSGQPTVTIRVNHANDTDQVIMKGGRVGTLNTPTGGAVDTLVGVEYVALGGEVAQSQREDDTIDVTPMVTGAVVDYTNGEIRTSATPGTGVQLVIEGIVNMENVLADGNDLVIVADAAVMNTNARSDELNGTAAKNILFMTYLDFDDLNTGATTRKSFAAQVGDGTITQVINQGQFSFSLSHTGTAPDVDRVSYHNELGRIIVPVGQGSATNPQYVVVDGDMDNVLSDAESRVDVLRSVEEIVAARGESVMDFTAVGQPRQITYQYSLAANPAENQVVEQTIRIADGNGNSLTGLNAFVERYTYNKTTPAVADATWNRIEGSDAAEIVIYQGSEDLVNQSGLDHRFTTDVLNLRGGNNEVRYSPLETSITAVITVVEENPATTTVAEGKITAVVTFQDGLGVAAPSTTFLGGMHTITSNTSDNSTSAGNLKIEGSQDAEDVVEFTGLGPKTFLLGTSPGVINVNIGASVSMVLTGFEFVQDAASNDIYNFASLVSTTGLRLLDNATGDHDVIKVNNDAAGAAFNGGVAGNTTISLTALNTYFTFDFDVLDISSVNLATLTTVNGVVAGLDDELVTGVFGTVATTAVNDFEAVVVSNATIAAHGATFALNTTANTLVIGTGAGAKTLQFNADMNNLSFGGTMLGGVTGVPRATTAVTVTVTGPDAVSIRGSDGADSITTAGGNDTIRGGMGNDVIDAGFTPAVGAVLTQTIGGVGTTSGTAGGGGTVTIAGLTLTTAVAPATETQIGEGADADQIGGRFAAVSLATWVTALTGAGLTAAEAGALTSVTYNATTNALVFTFAANAAGSTITAADLTGANTPAAAGDAVLTDGGEAATGFVAAVESLDTYVFEATAAANGHDTINNFNATNVATDDMLDFTAFLGGAAVQVAAAANGATGDLVMGGSNVGVMFGKGTLVAGDIKTAGTAAHGEVIVADNGKAVVLVTADADGVSDGVNQPYFVYFVQDTNATVGAQTFTVTLVGTINSVAELNAADLLAGGDAGDVFV